MTYQAYVTRVQNIEPIEKADRLNKGVCFGNPVVIDKSVNETSLYIYFPVDGQLGKEYAEKNNLLRKKDGTGGYLDPDKRNIKAISLRGVKSDGLVMPLSSLEGFGDYTKLKYGDTIDTFNGNLICTKYIPKTRVKSAAGTISKNTVKKNICPQFLEHKDTSQLAFNLDAFRVGDLVEISLKMHGTSQRTGFLPIEKYKRNFFDKIFKRKGKLTSEYDYITGTRRVVLKDFNSKDGFYEDNDFRKIQAEKLIGKLHKGETVYYEIVGYVNDSTPIMPSCKNSKLKDKEFIKKYGEETTFHYGCEPGTSEMYVYRMTMTSPDGHLVEYSYPLMKIRCEQIGVNIVPALETFFYRNEKDLLEKVEKHIDGIDPIGKTHIREGVVVRIENRAIFTAFKSKNFSFKVLEGIIKEDALSPDMEEAQEEV